MDNAEEGGRPTAEERERIRQFRTAFNRIDKELRKRTGVDRSRGFPQVLQRFGAGFGHDIDLDFLLDASRLRNLLIHNEMQPHEHFAVPSQRSFSALQVIAKALLAPVRVLPIFRKKVRTITLDDTLETVLRVIDSEDFSQFPVYRDGAFKGLLTENGITRWLAHHVTNNETAIEARSVTVRTLIREEEDRGNYAFISQSEEIAALRKRFADMPALEAVFITADGSKDAALLGIATTWDISRVTI